jgi:alpha-beta hydrolase superfamily lysophospholipase
MSGEHREGTLTADDGVALAWQAWFPTGKPEAAVGLIHGGAEHGGRYPALVSALTERGCAVYALDLRGHGRSGGRCGHVDRFSDYMSDLETFFGFVRSETGEIPIFVLGYSLGGTTSSSYALTAQEQFAGVIMVGPALAIGESASKLQFAIARTISALAPRLPLFKMKPEEMMSDPEAVRAYREDPLVFHGRFDARLLAELLEVMRAFPDRIGELELPLLVVHGGADVTADPEGSRIAIESAGSEDKTLRVYDGLRHDVFNEPDRDTVCREVADWIAARVATPSSPEVARA